MKNDNIKIVIVAVINLLLILPMKAQNVYSLEQCRKMAMEKNIKRRTSINNIMIAEEQKKVAFTKYFPTIEATGTVYNSTKGLIQTNLGGINLSMLKNGVMGGVTVTQPIFVGGRIINSNRLAKINVEVSRLQQCQSQNEIRQTVEQYYWQLVILKEKLRTIDVVDRLLANTVNDVEAAVKAGVSRRNDLLQIQLRQNDIKTDRINLDNSLDLCRQLLAQYIGAKEDSFNIVDPFLGDTLPDLPVVVPVDHTNALSNTAEYRLLDKNVESSNLQKRLEVGKNMPSVTAGAGYMYDNLMDKSHTFGIMFATVSVPLSGWWGGSHSIKGKALKIRNAEYERDDNRELLLIGMQKSLNDWEDACKKTVVAQKSIEQSTENLRLNENYYKAGTSTMSDLLDAQTLYQQSRDKYVEAYGRCKINQLEYEIATGR